MTSSTSISDEAPGNVHLPDTAISALARLLLNLAEVSGPFDASTVKSREDDLKLEFAGIQSQPNTSSTQPRKSRGHALRNRA